MTGDRIVFGRPHFDHREEELVLQVLRSRWIGHGPMVAEFEQRLATYLGSDHVIAVSSCTAALELALMSAGIGPGDEVITTPFTFVATIDAIERVGATPVFVDIDDDTLNIHPQAVKAAVTPRTAALMPVHFGGRPLDVAGLRDVADAHDLWVVEDAAHAIGGWAAGRRIGGSGHPKTMTCFSFYPNKNLASAEGGAVSLADPDAALDLRSRRQHGLDADAWNRWTNLEYRPSLAVNPGLKANWSDVQAAIALAQLEKLEGFLATREFLARRYDELLREAATSVRPIARGTRRFGNRHALHLYQVAVADPARRDSIVGALKAQGIGAAVHYLAVHLHPRYVSSELAGSFPVSEWASRSLVSLPLHPGLSASDQRRTIDALVEAAR